MNDVPMEMVGAKNLSPRLGNDTAAIEPLEFGNVPMCQWSICKSQGRKIFRPMFLMASMLAMN
jgi:hypothetical protein